MRLRRAATPAPARVSVPGERHARRAGRRARAPAPAGGGGLRRSLRVLSTVAIVSGALMVSDAAITLVWQEPITYLLAARQQSSLREGLATLRAASVTGAEQRALAELRGTRGRIAFLARSLSRTSAPGSPIGELDAPRLGKKLVLVKGSAPADLRKGPGTYDDVGLPGVPGTAAIAGHRSTYGAPFRDLDRLRPRDRISVSMPYATFTYRVERTRIVEPTDLSVLTRRRYDRLVLSACHPLYSAAQRIVVLARLVRTEPAGALSATAITQAPVGSAP